MVLNSIAIGLRGKLAGNRRQQEMRNRRNSHETGEKRNDKEHTNDTGFPTGRNHRMGGHVACSSERPGQLVRTVAKTPARRHGWPSAHSRPPGADYIIQAERNAIVYLLQNSGRLGVVALAMMVRAMAHRVHRQGEASE